MQWRKVGTETGSGSSSGRYLTRAVCRVLCRHTRPLVTHTGDIETRRWCNQLSGASPHQLPAPFIPRPSLNTNIGKQIHKLRKDCQTNSRVYFQQTRACNSYTIEGFPYYLSTILDNHYSWLKRIYFPNRRNWFDGFFTLMWFASRIFFSTKHSIKIFLSLLRFRFCFSLYLG